MMKLCMVDKNAWPAVIRTHIRTIAKELQLATDAIKRGAVNKTRLFDSWTE